jgi:hypothetical protein
MGLSKRDNGQQSNFHHDMRHAERDEQYVAGPFHSDCLEVLPDLFNCRFEFRVALRNVKNLVSVGFRLRQFDFRKKQT